MKARELRMGNLIYSWTGQVIEAGPVLFIYNPHSTYNIDDCNPIPLTEEWLLRCGFQKGGFVCDWWEDNNMFALDIFEDGYKLCIGEELRGIKIHYVHQLQNLYFALAGEELTIKEIAK